MISESLGLVEKRPSQEMVMEGVQRSLLHEYRSCGIKTEGFSEQALLTK